MVTLVREVADTVDLVSRTIQNARQIAAAFKDARGYLTKRYPGANADLAGLLTEMRLTLVGLAKVSDVITGFQFTVSGAGRDLEPARFNNLVIERKHLLSELRNSISRLKGSSGKMNDYATALTEHSGRPAWQLFDVMGLSDQRAAELGQQFNDLYVVDGRIIELIETLMNASGEALQAVSDALGPPGAADPENVASAAKVLGEYAVEFRRLEDACTDLSSELENQVNVLA